MREKWEGGREGGKREEGERFSMSDIVPKTPQSIREPNGGREEEDEEEGLIKAINLPA